ncbi:hypothetical protein GC194_04405 [bacterium]|nr:hypothetical protein [bacterium]
MGKANHSIAGRFIALRDMIVNYKSGWVTVAFGTLLFVLVLCIVFAVPCPTRAQYSVLRIALAAGISGMSIGLLVFIKNENWVPLKLLWMLGTFSLAYLTNPASLVLSDDCQFNYDFIEGYVVLSGEPVVGAELSLSEYDQISTTNNSGSFFLPFYRNRDSDSRNVKVHWGSYDTLVNLQNAEPGKTVRIEIPKEIAFPNQVRINKIIRGRINQCLEWINAQHKGLMDAYPHTQEVTINHLIRSCVPYEKTAKYQRNYYSFSNGIEEIQFKKNLTTAGIVPGDYQLESSFKLDLFKAFLFEEQTELADYHVSYGLINRKVPNFKVEDVQPREDGTCIVIVEYDDPVQYLFVSRNYNKLEDKQRKKRMEFYGLKPIEQLILQRNSGQWELQAVE